MPIELWADPESGNTRDGADDSVGEAMGDEELDRVLRNIDRQEGPSPGPAQSHKKTLWVGWSVTSLDGAPSRNGSQKIATQTFSWLWKRG